MAEKLLRCGISCCYLNNDLRRSRLPIFLPDCVIGYDEVGEVVADMQSSGTIERHLFT
jgi:hypothetical protein